MSSMSATERLELMRKKRNAERMERETRERLEQEEEERLMREAEAEQWRQKVVQVLILVGKYTREQEMKARRQRKAEGMTQEAQGKQVKGKGKDLSRMKRNVFDSEVEETPTMHRVIHVYRGGTKQRRKKKSEKRKGGESDSDLEVAGPSKKVRLEKSKKGYKACDR